MRIRTGKRAESQQDKARAKFAQQMEKVIQIKNAAVAAKGQQLRENGMQQTDHFKRIISLSPDLRMDYAKKELAKKIHERNKLIGRSDVFEQAEREAAQKAELARKKQVLK